MSSKRTVACSSVLGLLVAAPAFAIPITVVQEVSFLDADDVSHPTPLVHETVLSATFQRFDSSLGVLSNVDLSFDFLGIAVGVAELNPAPGSAASLFSMQTSAVFRGLFGSIEEPLGSEQRECDSECFISLRFDDLVGTLNVGFGPDVTQLAPFVGTTPFALDGVLQTTAACVDGSGSVSDCALVRHLLSGALSVAYTYEPTVAPPVSVPEPSTLSLLGLGSLAFTLVRRRKHNVAR